MGKTITKIDAVKLSGLDEKTFDNYFKNADEFSCLPRQEKTRFLFDEDELKRWREDRKWRTTELNFEDYTLCLDFALAQHFRGYVLSDWGTARQREFGQKITNWVKGQLGEVAVRKFLKKEFGLEVELDFDIYTNIVPQDIIGVFENRKMRKPKIGVGIKSSKPKSAYLVLSGNEIKLAERRSDIYIYCRPDIPDDHLLRLTKDQVIKAVKDKPHFSKYKDFLPDFHNIPCEIVGWCRFDELEEVSSIPGLEFENGTRFVKKSGELHKTKDDWKKLIKML
ncbi:MAG: hypothetical protein WD967_00780 [Candidatus Levyibacteriota bacterium]